MYRRRYKGKWFIPLLTSFSRLFHTQTFKSCQKPHEQRKNYLFPYELVVPGYFTHELLSHAKNHMNNFFF